LEKKYYGKAIYATPLNSGHSTPPSYC